MTQNTSRSVESTAQDDLFTLGVIDDPYTYLGRLRERDPIHWNALYELWVITRHDDLTWITGHHELFSSAVIKRDSRPPYPPVDEADLELYEYVRGYMADQFAERDPPELLAMRKVPQGYFTPNSVESLRPMIRSVIRDLLDAAQDKGRMDMRSDFATPLPVMVIAHLMGIPPRDRPLVTDLARKLLVSSQGEPDRLRTQTDGMKGMLAYLSPLVEERFKEPGDDLISAMARGEKKGVFTRHQVLVNCATLLVAGHETTINLLCNGALAFMRHPDQWNLFRQDPQKWARPATEEILRYDPPVKSFHRIATQDVEIRGKVIRNNDRIRCFISAANRDPDMFANADTFDISRERNPHVAFGSGVHYCLGAPLARLEAQEAFKALAERLPSLRATSDDLEYRPSISHRSLKSLPVIW
jgi:cytochrome P450